MFAVRLEKWSILGSKKKSNLSGKPCKVLNYVTFFIKADLSLFG